MLPTKDVGYFRLRAEREREMARQAASPEIAAIHEQMARDYDERVQQLEPQALIRSA